MWAKCIAISCYDAEVYTELRRNLSQLVGFAGGHKIGHIFTLREILLLDRPVCHRAKPGSQDQRPTET